MKNRIIEIVKKDVIDDQYFVMSEYNEYDENNNKIQTLSRTYHYFPFNTSDENMVEWIRVNEYKQEKYKDLEKTDCVYTYIEERIPPDYIRYVRADGLRWEVIGICTGIGTCWEGSTLPKPELDSVITPWYKNNCCQMVINILSNAY